MNAAKSCPSVIAAAQSLAGGQHYHEQLCYYHAEPN
jgi:hypothetical protein